MLRSLALLIALLLVAAPAHASKKVLFDNAHAETAGNADWVIDDNQPIPSPDQSGIGPNTPGTFWNGGISSYGVDMVKRGWTVATNLSTITYGNGSNPYDLSNYDLFVVPEPNTLFSASEAAAILAFVQGGGGLVAISDHYGSDRNNDGYDSPRIWNALDPTHLLGVHFGVSGDANNDITQTSTNVNPSASDSVTHGPVGTVAGLAFHDGTTFTLYPGVNPTVRGEVWMTGVSQSSTTGIMAASSQYGSGRVFFIGDSSPVDDGSAEAGNSSIYDGWGEAGATDSTLFLNASFWAARRASTDAQAPSITLTSPVGGEDWKAGSSHAITWTASDNVGVTGVDLAWSGDGGASFPHAIASGLANTGSYAWSVPNAPGAAVRVRATAHDAAGNVGADSSATDFTIDTWIITAGAGANGTIAPAGSVPVVEGASQPFTVTPAAGCIVADVQVDGGSVGAVAGYTFTGVAANHTIAATFTDVTPPTVTVTSPDGGEQWSFGDTDNITWSASDNAGVDSVEIDYSTTGSAGPWIPVAHGLANSGTYGWVVPPPATLDAVVRVTALDRAGNAASDTSDAPFVVVDPSAGVGGGPAVLALARPLPNPSAGAALIGFSLPRPGYARLEIVDASGRRVAGFSGDFASGRHAWTWNGALRDGSRAHAGVYFVRLTTPFGDRRVRLVRRS